MTLTVAPGDVQPAVATTEERDGLSAVSKALAVLESMASASTVGLTEVALSTGMAKSTAHRLLQELGERGFVERAGSKYRLGSRFFELTMAMQWSAYGQLTDRARPCLERLFDQVGETVHLAVLEGREVLYLEKITSRTGCRIPSRVGGRMPVTCTALGKAILAFSPRPVIEDCLRAPLPRLTPYSIATPALLAGQIMEIRATGVAYEFEESRLGVMCAAVPVCRAGAAVAAVSLATAENQRSAIDHADVLHEAAQRIQDLLDD